ncbi:cell wall / vacuolar inhibitor of fructosidase 2-like [Papaver somniferum]|uniref:cell wall / vacuolar inhibitor of fructosidase 2-like n=1 Tax=Papaver somniferum TaxID=3469 RepID=UPI000E6FD160|nr:cell wall / vacuolar inhibitor of fructosidase 2-like [Papaver somniferum]
MGNCNHSFVFVLPLIIIISLFNSTAGEQSNERVDSICNQTSNPKFCVDAIYTDPRAPDANMVALAYISFGLAFTNATNTLSFIKELQYQRFNGPQGIFGLKQCGLAYRKAKNALDTALIDLESDTYELEQYAAVAAQSADRCEHSLNSTRMMKQISVRSRLIRRNTDLKLLAGICSVISSKLVR